jgi:hypothetical protein
MRDTAPVSVPSHMGLIITTPDAEQGSGKRFGLARKSLQSDLREQVSTTGGTKKSPWRDFCQSEFLPGFGSFALYVREMPPEKPIPRSGGFPGFPLSHENNRRATGTMPVLLLFSYLVAARCAYAVRGNDGRAMLQAWQHRSCGSTGRNFRQFQQDLFAIHPKGKATCGLEKRKTSITRLVEKRYRVTGAQIRPSAEQERLSLCD